MRVLQILSTFWHSANDIAEIVDDILGENGIEEFTPYGFSLIAEEFDVVGNGDFSLVIMVGPGKIAKLMTDEVEFKLMSRIMKEPFKGLPEVYDVGERLDIHVAIIKEYSRLPFEWRKAMMHGIHDSDMSDYEQVAKDLGLDPHSIEIFDWALGKLEEWGIKLKDWKPDNLMWNKDGNFPVLTDLG